MTDYFVTRHPGAVEWAKRKGLAVQFVADFKPAMVKPGDRVYGTLPVHLAAEVCAAGGRYFHLVLDLSPEKRGKELSSETMSELGADLIEYHVAKLQNGE